MPVLIDHRHTLTLVNRGDGHGAVVFDDFSRGRDATGHADLVDAQRQDVPLVRSL
jgi:hypothetical protein